MNKRLFTYCSRDDEEIPGQKHFFLCILSTWESLCAIGFFLPSYSSFYRFSFFILGLIWDYLVLGGSLLFCLNSWCLIFLIPLCSLRRPFVFCAHYNCVKLIMQAKTCWHFYKTSNIDLVFPSMRNILYCTSLLFAICQWLPCHASLDAPQCAFDFIRTFAIPSKHQEAIYGNIHHRLNYSFWKLASHLAVCYWDKFC